ncbi:MAG: hypothetical protein V2I43_24850 [Parvularcula sp.]|jgi:hypothetical protein|nr:hypothetical protein [Parvularcula sp.]
MTTIILTIIGILLAAAAALMVIFYGGDAFNSGTVGAQANQIQNAGTNVISAVQMFKAETANAPASLADLTTAGPNGAYLDELPALGDGQTAGLDVSTARQYYTVSGVPAQVCARINTNLDVTPGVAADLADAVTAAASGPKMGCYAPDATSPGFFVARA